ncbi:hypothetical protein HPP92_021589 [Vanilla planifolia]|uniref:Uncharacterized protein n=1 Tax=Vanilla planifolia TaxID=51239 RepID=A0A835Q4J8_VANPL|nr:hypothetical protein HPP92_021589 [Vanilla planifolia]
MDATQVMHYFARSSRDFVLVRRPSELCHLQSGSLDLASAFTTSTSRLGSPVALANGKGDDTKACFLQKYSRRYSEFIEDPALHRRCLALD